MIDKLFIHDYKISYLYLTHIIYYKKHIFHNIKQLTRLCKLINHNTVDKLILLFEYYYIQHIDNKRFQYIQLIIKTAIRLNYKCIINDTKKVTHSKQKYMINLGCKNDYNIMM
jgi:hypothetical protein